MGTRGTIVVMAALALTIAIGACGGDDEETSATGADEAGVTTDQGTEPETTTSEKKTEKSAVQKAGKQKKGGKNVGPSGVSIEGPIGKPTPGSRRACIRDVAGGFPPGPTREAVIRECKNLPR